MAASTFPRTPADAEAEVKCAAYFLAMEVEDFIIGRRRRAQARVDRAVFQAACELLQEHGASGGAEVAREWAAATPEGEVVDGDLSVRYFWARVACELESGAVR